MKNTQQKSNKYRQVFGFAEDLPKYPQICAGTVPRRVTRIGCFTVLISVSVPNRINGF